jgi:hypothetical protein
MKRIRTYDENLVPVCERCWIDENSLWEADSVDISGNIITRLISVTVPIELSPGAVADCYVCGRLTVVGIYMSSIELDGEDIELDELEEEPVHEEPTPDEL